MPYTNGWSNSIPAGSAAAQTIDDAIRQLRLDIQERMDTILAAGGKWLTDDPIVLDYSSVGVRTGVEVFFSHQAFQPEQDEDDVDRFDSYLQMDNGANSRMYLPLSPSIPVGSVIQSVSMVVDKAAAGNMDINLNYRTYSTSPAQGPVASTSETLTGIRETIVASGLGHTVLTDRMYYIVINNPSGGRHKVYGVKVTIDLPNLGAYV